MICVMISTFLYMVADNIYFEWTSTEQSTGKTEPDSKQETKLTQCKQSGKKQRKRSDFLTQAVCVFTLQYTIHKLIIL